MSASQIDEVIHQPLRLRIMAALVVLAPKDQLDFAGLRDLLAATDGNLGAHLLKLEDAGYIKMEKTFVARKPRTFVSATAKGRAAFEEHVEALKAIIAGVERLAPVGPEAARVTKGKGSKHA